MGRDWVDVVWRMDGCGLENGWMWVWRMNGWMWFGEWMDVVWRMNGWMWFGEWMDVVWRMDG